MLKFEENLASRVSGALQPMLGVQVTVTASNGLLATLYADDESTVLTNPVTTDANGYFGFKAANGEYTLTLAGAQIETTKRNIELYDADDDPPLTLAQAAGVTGTERIGGTWFGDVIATLAQLGTSIGSTLIGHGDKSIGSIIDDLLDRLDRRLPDNASLVAAAAAKIKSGAAKIVCVGDSMTYGHDQFSEDRIAPVAPHVQPRVPVPYPAKLQATLNSIHASSGIVVENRGFSGDTVKGGYARWTADPGADLAFVMYGINDAAVPGGISLAEYADYLARTIVRYNKWGCGVIVMTSTSMSQGNESRNVDPYRAVAIEVARQCGCPVFEADVVGLNNRKDDLYSDSVHFNSAGYGLLGNTVAMFIAAGGLLGAANVIESEKTIILGSEANVVTNGIYSHAAGAYTRQELLLQLTKATNHRVTFAFYMDADSADISLVGTLGLGSTIEIDFDSIRSVSTRKSIAAATTANYSAATDQYAISSHSNQYLGQVLGRGWHSVTIGASSSAAAGSNFLNAICVRPKKQIECVASVRSIEKRSFALFDPEPSFGALPPASTQASFTLPMSLFGTLPFKGSANFYGSNFLIVEICGIAGGVRSYTRSVVTPNSATTYAVTLLESIGTNAVSLASVTGPSVETTGANLVFALTRPAAGYIEMRFTVADSCSMRSPAQS